VVTVRSDRPGVAAARNAALAHARGTILVYLDDDNCFAPGWLSAVAWAFEHHPWAEVLYGAMVIDHPGRVDPNRLAAEALPVLMQRPFERCRLVQNNITDMGCIAHRSGLPEARFDETLATMHDWEFFGRLVCDRDPLVLPHPAVIYRTDAPNRLSRLHEGAPEIHTIRERLRELYARASERSLPT
jgi:glycosyltransferase involved in cell wall biosynthesis